MSIGSLYDTAKKYADKIMLEQPGFFSGNGGSLTLIADENNEIFFGITSIRVEAGRIVTVPSEYSAIASMVLENKSSAVEMVTISLSDYSVSLPEIYCINLMLRADSAAKDCRIAVSFYESITAAELQAKFTAEQPITGENDIPTEFMDGFDFGEGNSFDKTVYNSEPAETTQGYYNPVPENDLQQSYPNQPYAQPNQNPQGYPNQPYGYPPQMNGQQQFMPNQPYGYPPQMNGQQQFVPNQPYGYQPQMNGQQQFMPNQPYGYQPQMNGQQQFVPNQPYGYQQPMYGQPPQQSVYLDNANPYNVNPQGQSVSNYAADLEQPKFTEPEQNLMQKKLASLIGNDSSKSEPAKPKISKEEMLRQMNQEKKSAKAGFFGKK